MKSQIRIAFVLVVLCSIFLTQCAPQVPATPERVVETKIVVATQQVEVVVTATPAPASGAVKVLLIGKPDEDSIDPVSGATLPGVQHLKEMFEAEHPSIDMQIINIPWGSGSTGYGPKTESMIQAQESCVYTMPGAFQYGRRGYLENLDPWIKNDATFKDVWPGDYLEQWRGWGPGNPDNQWALPYSGGNRVIHYDAKLFKDWGVEPLSQHPTLKEIEEKAQAMTGTNPVTGEQNYGYWYQQYHRQLLAGSGLESRVNSAQTGDLLENVSQ